MRGEGEAREILVEIISFGVSTNLDFSHVYINQVCETRIYGEDQMEAEEDLKFPAPFVREEGHESRQFNGISQISTFRGCTRFLCALVRRPRALFDSIFHFE